MRNREDLFKGMFWGLVIGDCLGSPIQFTSKDDHQYITEMEYCHHFNAPAGSWTDDSSMAFCIAESYVRCGKYDLDDIANNFIRWFIKGFWSSLPYAFDIGDTTYSAIKNMSAGGGLRNGSEESQGNGSIIRLAPAYLIAYKSSDRKILHEIGALTHASSVVEKVTDRMAEILDNHIDGEKSAYQSPYKTREEVNNSGWAVSTLDAALWAFENSNSFEEGMILAVNLGGDADSIGAVYGQIAGAWYGFPQIPQRWIQSVKNFEKIEHLIDSLIEKCELKDKSL